MDVLTEVGYWICLAAIPSEAWRTTQNNIMNPATLCTLSTSGTSSKGSIWKPIWVTNISIPARVSPMTIHPIIACIQNENLLNLYIATNTAQLITTLQITVIVVWWNSISSFVTYRSRITSVILWYQNLIKCKKICSCKIS